MALLKYENSPRGQYTELTIKGHRDWMRDQNPQRWDLRTWTAFNARMGSDPGFAARARELAAKRHRWIDEELRNQINGRRVSATVVSDLRRDLVHQAETHFPRENPFSDGWEMPEKPDPFAAVGVMRDSRAERTRGLRSALATQTFDDESGLAAARAANAARPIEQQPRSWHES